MKSQRLPTTNRPDQITTKARGFPGRLCFLAFLLLAAGLSLTTAKAAIPKEFHSFLAAAFGERTPPARRLWLNEPQKQAASDVLQRPVKRRSLRYWGDATHNVWLLNEIGKERPITTAIEIENGRVKRVRVITYRESRGGEVQANWFLRQFYGMRRDQLNRIHKSIDSISGATLSVNALKKQVALALLASGWLMAEEAGRETLGP